MLMYPIVSSCFLLLIFFSDGLFADRIQEHSNDALYDQYEEATGTEGWCHTKHDVTKHSLTWTLSNFSLIQKDVGQLINSSAFPDDSSGSKYKWRMQLYPNGSRHEHKEKVSLYFLLVEGDTNQESKITGRVEVSIVNDQQEHVPIKRATIPERLRVGKDAGWSELITRAELMQNKAHLLPDDKLTVHCVVYECAGMKEQSGRLFRLPKLKSTLPDDFGHLLESGDMSDVTIVVAGREFKAHKAILGARSPMLKAMFSHDMKESQSSRVEVDDIDPKLFEEILRYIYSGRSLLEDTQDTKEDQQSLVVVDLMAAAAKYQLAGLMSICEQFLYKSLTVESLIDVLSVADQYNSEWLRERSVEFMTRHSMEFTQMLAKGSPEMLAKVATLKREISDEQQM